MELEKTVIGWREFVALPEWGIQSVRAKIDTGALTSAIHVASVEDIGDDRIRFEVVTRERPRRRSIIIEARTVREATVRPSSGRLQKRHVVATPVEIAGITQNIEISLVCRKGMLCRMLIGRKALEDRFIVDPSARYLGTPSKAGTKTRAGAESQ